MLASDVLHYFGRFLPAFQGRWTWAKHWGSNNFPSRTKAGKLQNVMEKELIHMIVWIQTNLCLYILSLMLIGVGIIVIDGLYNFFKTDHSLLVPVDFLRIWLGVRWAWGTELAFLYLHVVYPRLLQLWSCNNVVSSPQFILYKYYYSDANYPIPGWFCAKQWVSADLPPFL